MTKKRAIEKLENLGARLALGKELFEKDQDKGLEGINKGMATSLGHLADQVADIIKELK